MTYLLTDDEAAKVLEALVTGREYAVEALNDYIEKYDDHPATVAGQKIISESLHEMLEALIILENAKQEMGLYEEAKPAQDICQSEKCNCVGFCTGICNKGN